MDRFRKAQNRQIASHDFKIFSAVVAKCAIDKLHQLLDQAQQLLLNEQKKNQLLLESKSKNELSDWKGEKDRLESQVQFLQETSQLARQELKQKQTKLEKTNHLLNILAVVSIVFSISFILLALYILFAK